MIVTLATDADQSLWDNYVLNHKDATPYHLFAWKQAVMVAYGHTGYYFIAFADNLNDSARKVIGVLPFTHLKIPLRRGTLISLPFCDTADALFDDSDIEQQLYGEAFKLSKKAGVNEIELRSVKQSPRLIINTKQIKTYSHKVRMFLDLPEDSETLFKSFKSKLRSQIRKPEKEGLHFEWGGINKLDDFYQVFSANMKDLGSPVHSKRWFSEILNFFKDKARMGLVFKGQKVVGCGIILLVNNKVTIPWASTLKAYNYLSPNMMLYWNLLSFASDNGYSQFDFGRSSPGEGTYKFKSQWGAKPNPLYWHHVYLDNTKSIERSTIGEVQSTRREMAIRLWRRLPLCVATALGARIRKYISL